MVTTHTYDDDNSSHAPTPSQGSTLLHIKERIAHLTAAKAAAREILERENPELLKEWHKRTAHIEEVVSS